MRKTEETGGRCKQLCFNSCKGGWRESAGAQAGVTFRAPDRNGPVSRGKEATIRGPRCGETQWNRLCAGVDLSPGETQVRPSLAPSLQPPGRERSGTTHLRRPHNQQPAVSSTKHVKGSRSWTLSSAHPNMLPPLPGGRRPNRRAPMPD